MGQCSRYNDLSVLAFHILFEQFFSNIIFQYYLLTVNTAGLIFWRSPIRKSTYYNTDNDWTYCSIYSIDWCIHTRIFFTLPVHVYNNHYQVKATGSVIHSYIMMLVLSVEVFVKVKLNICLPTYSLTSWVIVQRGFFKTSWKCGVSVKRERGVRGWWAEKDSGKWSNSTPVPPELHLNLLYKFLRDHSIRL